MSDDSTIVSPQALADAQASYAEVDALLNDPDIPAWDGRREAWTHRKIAADAVIRRALAAAEPEARGQTVEAQAQVLASKLQTRDAIKHNLQAMRQADEGDPETGLRVEYAIALSQQAHAEDQVPGRYTDADVRAVTKDAGMTDLGHGQFLAAAARLGAGGLERMQFGYALRDSPPEPEETLTPDVVSARWDQWWGGERDANEAHAERAWVALTKAERVALSPRRGGRPFMEAMVKLGKRLAAAR